MNCPGFKHIFWSVIVCVAMGCAAIFLYSNTIDFMNATVVTTVDTMTVPLSEVFFPSVVVCNINQVSVFKCFSKKIQRKTKKKEMSLYTKGPMQYLSW